MNIKAKRIYWTNEEPKFFFGPKNSKPGTGHSFALIVLVGDGGTFQNDKFVNQLRTLCPNAPSDEILTGRVQKGTEFLGDYHVHYSTILPKRDYAGWETVDGRPDFI
jgi:hypothetical protein